MKKMDCQRKSILNLRVASIMFFCVLRLRPFNGKKRAFTSESDPTGFYCQTSYKGENPEQEKRAIARCYRATG